MARCRMLSAGSLPRLSGSFDDGKNRVMIYGPKNVGTNIIEFIAQTGGDDRDTQGRRLSAPRTTVPRDGEHVSRARSAGCPLPHGRGALGRGSRLGEMMCRSARLWAALFLVRQ